MSLLLSRVSIGVFIVAWSALVQAASLAGTEWKPLRMGDVAMPSDSSAYLQFRSKGRLTGFSGCNRLMAHYSVVADIVFVGPVGATRQLCAEPVMAREAALAAALEQARTYRRQTTELVFFDAGGRPILELRQTDWD